MKNNEIKKEIEFWRLIAAISTSVLAYKFAVVAKNTNDETLLFNLPKSYLARVGRALKTVIKWRTKKDIYSVENLPAIEYFDIETEDLNLIAKNAILLAECLEDMIEEDIPEEAAAIEAIKNAYITNIVYADADGIKSVEDDDVFMAIVNNLK